jgi:hypothetical protein
MVEFGTSRDGTLRCGRCFRNLATGYGQDMHDVYLDGSMRCRAPEAEDSEKRDADDRPFASTFVVLESSERRQRVAEVANQGVWAARRG